MLGKINISGLGIAFFLSLVATGCVETSTMFHGNSPSPAMNVVSLQNDGSQSGALDTFEISINYKYLQSGEVLDISGQVVLSEHFQLNYISIIRLEVYLFFLDEDSRVLKTAQIVRSMTGSVDEVMTFSQQYTVPAGAKSFSFGYDGTTREVRGDIFSFYELPLKKN